MYEYRFYVVWRVTESKNHIHFFYSIHKCFDFHIARIISSQIRIVMCECFQIQATTSSVVAPLQKIEPKLFVNGAEISDGKPDSISKIEVLENKLVVPEPSTTEEIKPEQTTPAIKVEETKSTVDKDSFIVTPDYIQQSMLHQSERIQNISNNMNLLCFK